MGFLMTRPTHVPTKDARLREIVFDYKEAYDNAAKDKISTA